MYKFIEIKGAREHNLKNIFLRIPKNQLLALTGPSGGGSKGGNLVATSKAMDNTDHIEFVNNTIVERIQELQKEEGNNIWLFGGSGLTNQFMKADLVDEFIIGIIPTILGGGRPLFFDGNPMVNLHLDSYTIQEGLPILIYSRRVS